MKYVRSLKDPVKRRFGLAHLLWVRGSRKGVAPDKTGLSPIIAKTVAINLDALI